MRTGMICCEELIYDMLEHCYPGEGPVELSPEISYAEADRTTQINLSCGGEAYDPFVQEEEPMGMSILKHMAEELEHRREDGLNRIRIRL